MPTNVVDVDLRSETGAVAEQTHSDLLVIARNPTAADPTYNRPLVFDAPEQVASEFGEGSDAHVASQEIASRGTRNWWVVLLESDAYNETLDGTDEQSLDEGTVEQTPMRGGTENITISIDGEEADLIPSTKSPPEKPDTGGEAAVNTDTGEVVIGDTTSGTGDGIVVEYETLDWNAATPNMDSGDFDLVCLADTRADRSYIGDLDALLNWAEPDGASVILAYEDGSTYENDEAAMEAAHDIGGYLPSGNVLPIAHKSNDDVAAGFAGRLANKNPWFNPYMDGGADFTFSTEEYRKALIGSPDVPGTFEGGDSNGSGPCNVLYTQMGSQILSNSLSTAGADSNYQFFDVSRTESFIIAEIERSLRSLRLHRESIPFAPIGRTIIEATLRDRLNKYVAPRGQAMSPGTVDRSGDDDDEEPAFTLSEQEEVIRGHANVPLSELEIHVPRYDELTQSARANRVWDGVQITARLAGNAHTFNVELAVQV